MARVFCLVTLLTFISSISALTELNSKLHDYEILESVSIHTIAKRSADTHKPHKNVRFSALGRNFSLHLTVDDDVFSKDFKLVVIDGHGKSKVDRNLNTSNFFIGTMDGEERSYVLAYFDHGAMSASISTKHDDYTVEPLWRHTKTSNKATMVVYRNKDIKVYSNDTSKSSAEPQYCGAVKIVEDEYHHYTTEPASNKEVDWDQKKPHRNKRATISRNRCFLMGVADFRFFRDTGGNDLYTTANYMIMTFAKANTIFKGTSFVYGTGLGFQLVELRVHQAFSAESDFPYNTVGTTSDGNVLLQKFSTGTAFRPYCLVHLFTHRNMGNTNGMAYIAGESSSQAGGMCSSTYTSGGKTYTANTGFTTTMNSVGLSVLTKTAELVTAHELGHGWGSQHDPDSCIPTLDGKYLMYSYSVTGDDINNFRLSSCSINYINRILSNKATTCLRTEIPESLCSNGLIDSSNGEQCDGGILGRLNLDQCCNPICRLYAGKVCTPVNYPCCTTECQIAGTGLLCAGGVAGSCVQDTYCNGRNLECPTPAKKPNGSECLDGGSCLNGECKSYCEYRGLTSCVCSDAANSCKKCCKQGGQCVVHNATAFLSEGRPCTYGYCDKTGVCIKTEGSTINKLWNFIDEITFDYVVEAFRTNMVAFIQVFSLILFVPLSCCAWCTKKISRRNRELAMNRETKLHMKLTYDLDGNEIQPKKTKPRTRHRNIREDQPLPPITPRAAPPSVATPHPATMTRRPMSGRPGSVYSMGSRRNQVVPVSLRKQEKPRQ